MVNSAGTAVSCFLTGDAGPVPTLLWWPCDSDSPRYWNGAGPARVSSGFFCLSSVAVCVMLLMSVLRAEPVDVCVTNCPCFWEGALFFVSSHSQGGSSPVKGCLSLPAMSSAVFPQSGVRGCSSSTPGSSED